MKQKIEKLSDEKLVEVVRNGNSELYREIIERYQAKLIRYGCYLSLNKDEAKDVVQESFIKAYKNLYRFNTAKKFSSWIYRIVHNEAINYIKKKKKELSLDLNQHIKQSLKADSDLVKKIEQSELKKAVRSCLDSMPYRYREPLVLYYLEENSYEEVSDILRLPIGTVGTRIKRGKKLLKKLMQTKDELK